MRAFACPRCRALVAFENSVCVTCGAALAYSREQARMVELLPPEGTGTGTGGLHYASGDRSYVPCANLNLVGCNWLAEVDAPEGLCSACRLTRVRPADTDSAGMAQWHVTETAKRRLLFQLDALGLPTTPRSEDPGGGLAFDLLSSTQGPVTTGHDSGVITIDLAEGDDPHREALRVQLTEPYRTVLGHLRHETGHWYWEVLVDGTPALEPFRELFGDEQRDYAEALAQHYGKPNTGDWAGDYVSHYAASHPWEDWAETFAHYLHIRDTIETAASWGLSVAGPNAPVAVPAGAPVSAVPARTTDAFEDIVRTWLPLTYALNAINRSMGMGDLYPFVLTPPVLRKLEFVHDRVVEASRGS